MSDKRSSRVALASVALLVSGLALAGLFMSNNDHSISNETNDFVIPVMTGIDPEYCYSKYPSMISRKLKAAYIKSHSNQRNVFALSRDKGTLMLTNKPGEKYVTLESPRLMSQSGGGPFELVFDVMFPTKTSGSVGRHGGVFWGARRKEAGRWNGHRTKQAGAETSVIDWIDRRSDHGIRIYGVRTAGTMNHYLRPLPNPPSEWRILFHGDGKGTFTLFADGRNVATLEGVAFGADAYFGFYSYDRSDMVISNVRIRSINSVCPKPLSMDEEDEESFTLDLSEDTPREEELSQD